MILIQELDLSNNKLTMLDHVTVKALEKTNLKLVLDGNPWKCEDNDVSQNFLKYAHAKKYNEIFNTCINSEEIDLDSGFYGYSYAVLMSLVVMIVFGIILSSAGFLMIVELIAKKLDDGKIYDAFILLHKDEDFVAEELVSKLKKESWPFKLSSYIKNRTIDWVPNQSLAEQSRRTIVILSKNFIDNVWSTLEFQATHKQALEENSNRIIVILRGDLGPTDNLDAELQVFLESKTCLKWDDLRFWKGLRIAMLRTSLLRIINHKNTYQKKCTDIIRNKLEKVETTNAIYTVSKSIGEKFSKFNSMQTAEKNFNEFI